MKHLLTASLVFFLFFDSFAQKKVVVGPEFKKVPPGKIWVLEADKPFQVAFQPSTGVEGSECYLNLMAYQMLAYIKVKRNGKFTNYTAFVKNMGVVDFTIPNLLNITVGFFADTETENRVDKLILYPGQSVSTGVSCVLGIEFVEKPYKKK